VAMSTSQPSPLGSGPNTPDLQMLVGEAKTSPTLPALPSTGQPFSPEALAWQDDAECKGLGHLFFSPQEWDDFPKLEPGRRERIAKAKAVCASCAVFEECEQWAKDSRLAHGILAGLTATERRAKGWFKVTPLTS